MKAHVASIAILLLLGIAITAFMFMVKNKSEERGKEMLKDNFSKQILHELSYSISSSCKYGESSLIVDVPEKVIIYSKDNITLCVQRYCKEIEFKNENCTIGKFNITLYKSIYQIEVNGKENIVIEGSLWQ